MAQSKKFKKPWSVHSEVLPIVEIVDADGDTVLPWGGFDATGLSDRLQLRLAREIVEAVNAAAQHKESR